MYKSKKNTALDAVGLGQEERVKHKDMSTNPTQGTKTSMTLDRNKISADANQTKAVNSTLPRTSKIIEDLKRQNPLSISTPAIGPLKESSEQNTTVTYGASSRIDKCLALFENYIEEYSSKNYSTKMASGAGGAQGGGKGVESSSAQHSQLLSSYKASVSNKIDDSMQRSAVANQISSSIKPGTGHVRDSAMVTRAGAMEQGAENNAVAQDRLNQQYQDKQAQEQGQ